MKSLKISGCIIMFCALLSLSVVAQNDTLFVYGPGGPFGPINECAQVFGRHHNIIVKVTAGPEANWIEPAKKNADLIYGGAEYMLTQFEIKHNNLVNKNTRTELFKRGAAILIRPGNPKNIHSFDDLTKSGLIYWTLMTLASSAFGKILQVNKI